MESSPWASERQFVLKTHTSYMCRNDARVTAALFDMLKAHCPVRILTLQSLKIEAIVPLMFFDHSMKNKDLRKTMQCILLPCVQGL